MEKLGITGVQALLLIGAVAGTVELIKRIFDRDWRAVATIIGAGLVGGLVTLFPDITISFLTGVVGGLAASGFITIGQNIGRDTAL